MSKYFTKEKIAVIVVLVIILIAGFVLRFYHHHEWLYFKMDQARDAAMTSNAVQYGAIYLPLLGPRAGATKVPSGYLRLGPMFYYFQYIAGKLFNSTSPDVFAYPELFFSVAAIIMLYIFSRLYFSRTISLLISAMYASCFIVVEYSRFSWNPNSLPFFMILGFYGLIRFLNEERSKKKIWWLALCATGLSVGSQLHFFGFFSLIAISVLVAFFHYETWKKENLKKMLKKEYFKNFIFYVLVFLAFFAIFYVPVFISEVIKNFQNTKDFFYAIGSKPGKESLISKIIQNTFEQIRYFTLILTSVYYTNSIKKNLSYVIPTLATVFTGVALAYYFFKRQSRLKKDFLILVICWIAVFFVLSIPVAFQLRPRFFLVVFPLPFILLGIIFDYALLKIKKDLAYAATFIVSGVVIAANGHGIQKWFQEQAKSQIKSTPVSRTLILKNKDGVTLGQLERVVDFIYQNRKPGADIYYYVKPEHVFPIKYLLRQKNDPSLKYFPMAINGDPNAQYFAVVPGNNGLANLTAKYGDIFTEISSAQCGQLAVYEVALKNPTVDPNFKIKPDKSKIDRVFWKDVFGVKGNTDVQIDSEKETSN